MIVLYVWADGTTCNQDEPLPTYMSDDYITVDGNTTFGELIQWIGITLARDVAKEYHGIL